MKNLARHHLLLIAILLVGAGLRAIAMQDEFWLDEAWSAIDVRGQTISQIYTTYVDNNHLLNSFWMRAVNNPSNWIVYRIPSVLAGIGSIALAYTIGRRRNVACAILSALVIAISFPLLVYSTEARGYSLAIFFALACYALLLHNRWPILYWLCAILGLLSHLTFAVFLISGVGFQPTRKKILNFHMIPLVTLLIIYLTFARHLKIAGGPPMQLFQVIWETARLFAGSALLAFLLILISLIDLARRRDSRLWMLVAPLLMLLASSRPEIVYPRYFLIPATFLLLLATEEIALVRRCAIPTALFIAFAVCNLYRDVQFIRYGRGGYLTAFNYIARNTPANPPTVGALWLGEAGDHDTRVRRLLEFYQPYIPKKIVLLKPPMQPEWLLVTSPTPQMPMILLDHYQFEEVFPHYGPSGWTWYLYHRAPTR